jgi:hypothetical protein
MMHVHGFRPSFYLLPDKEEETADYNQYLDFIEIVTSLVPTWQEGVHYQVLS